MSILMILALSGCNLRDPQYKLKAFKSCEALEASLKDNAVEEIRWAHSWGGGSFGFGREYAMVAESDMGAAMEDGATNTASAGGDRDYSDTNTQVSGVDEADLMETDGTYIYVLAGDTLVITKAWPAEDAAEVSRISLEGRPSGMFLRPEDGELVVLTQPSYQTPDPLSGESSVRVQGQENQVKTTIVDVADPADPVVLREVYTEGALYDARVVNDTLYVVSYSDLGTGGYIWGYDNKEAAIDAVKGTTLADWMPGRFDNLRSAAGATWSALDADISDCTSVFGSDRPSGNYMVNVESLDLSDTSAEFLGTSVLSSVDAIYANGENLYVVSAEASEGPWQTYDSTIETIIHRFDISDGQAAPEYMGSGEVPGWTLNQFSMDEHADHLRIVTTSADSEDTSAGLYVLDMDLQIVGEVEDLAPGEEVYAVRFDDDTGYVVTFEQIDPLFTFDLSDPETPQVVGELKITGFSNYLHPMDDDHLLAVGMQATADGWATNLQVSLFDVSDLADPKVDSQLDLTDAYGSEAQYEHLAFNYFGPAQTLLMPAYTETSTGSEMLMIHAAVGDELSESGRINQDDLVSALAEEYSWCAGFRRSVVIENYAYAISNAGISIADLDAEEPGAFHTVPFTGVDACAGEYYYW